MEIKLVAYDSFSTRSMATLILSKEVNIFIDPSISISPHRYGLEPHPLEIKALEIGKEKIKKYLDLVDVVVITHYHWDHCPHPKNNDIIGKFKDKIIIAKNFNEKINKSQHLRGKMVYQAIKDKAKELLIKDNIKMEFGKLYLEILGPVWHGKPNSKLGYVNMVYIACGRDSMLFGSDIQGPISNETAKQIIERDPKMVILSGPPTYLLNFKLSREDFESAKNNLINIISNSNVEKIIIDHHLLRDLKWKDRIAEVFDIAKQVGVEILTAAEYEGRANIQLEARRKELWRSSE